MKVLAHISDLHFGAESPEVVEGLIADLASLAPWLVAVSGDLTQRARRREFAAARAFLDRIAAPKLVVPGNHDIPLFDLIARFSEPLARFRRYIAEDVDPFVSTEDVAVLGINTARPSRWKEGRVSRAQIETLRRRLDSLPAHVVKVLVAHHPFAAPPGAPQASLVGRSSEALEVAANGRLDMVLTGHLHRGVTHHHDHLQRSMLVVQAGTATSQRIRDEPNSYNVIRISRERLRFSVRIWDRGTFREDRVAEYGRSGPDWRPTGPILAIH